MEVVFAKPSVFSLTTCLFLLFVVPCPMPQVISASRRTDIPACYAPWFVNRLRAGHVFVQNPYSRKMSRVSLAPGDVHAIVFWSKNYAPLLSRLDEIERTTKNLFFHFTITANRELELHAPDPQDAIRDYQFIARRYAAERIIWRYDPLCITDQLSFEIHEERFARCAEQLQGHATRCIISFAHPYKKVLANFQKDSGHRFIDPPLEAKKEYAERLALRARACGIILFACCNDYLLSASIGKASCIDGRYLSGMFEASLDTRSALTRTECACTKSMDIGAYNTCVHGCLYCYANDDKDRAQAAHEQHDPGWNALTMQVEEADRAPAEA